MRQSRARLAALTAGCVVVAVVLARRAVRQRRGETGSGAQLGSATLEAIAEGLRVGARQEEPAWIRVPSAVETEAALTDAADRRAASASVASV